MLCEQNLRDVWCRNESVRAEIGQILHTHTHTDASILVVRITESWANNDITYAELGLEGYVMFRKDRIARRGGGLLLYIKETIPAYEVQFQEEADCNEAIWCKLVTGHTTVTIGVVYRCPNITKQNNEKIRNVISEVSKGDCIKMGDFNHGNIKWDTLQSTGVEYQMFLCLVQEIS